MIFETHGYRFSPIIIGLGCAMMVSALIALAWPETDVFTLALIFAAVASGVPSAWGLGAAAFWLRERSLDIYEREQRVFSSGEQNTPPVPAPEPPPIIRSIPVHSAAGDDVLDVVQPGDAHMEAWREALQETLYAGMWYCGDGKLTSTALVGPGKPFSSNEDWMAVVAVLRDMQIVTNSHGVTTRLKRPWTYGSAIAMLAKAGEIDDLPKKMPPKITPAPLPWSGRARGEREE